MCISCYQEYGSPTKATPAVMAIIDDLGSADPFGKLHIIVDDWNLDDEDIDFCVNDASGTERELALRLKALDLHERATAMAIVEGFIPRPA